MSEYKVKFDVFEGPLDLLLYLIKKEEVDIYDVNLTRLATQFIEYIDMMRMLDLEVAGEFLVMTSTLMYIKSRELLPVEQQVTPEGEEDTDDPRWELIRQLVEYKKFKDAAAELQRLEVEQENIYPRIAAKPEFEEEAPALKPNVSVFDLINAVNSILKRFNQARRDERDIFEDKWTVSEKIELLRSEVLRLPSLKFSALFAEATSRTEVVVTFLAVLELIRLKVIEAQQSENFGEIEIVRAPERPIVAPAEGEAGPEATHSPALAPEEENPVTLEKRSTEETGESEPETTA
ncbi:MAG TPA: segregation/condensation protein A [Candidatus Saccharimonadales bacterium]|nr:segregation/condensation protein A [Candidatus Saccharimonadales bacterium]